MIINEKEMREIENLIPEHKDALVAYGADMYRQGMYTGAVCIVLGFGLVLLIDGSIKVYKHHKNKKKNEAIES